MGVETDDVVMFEEAEAPSVDLLGDNSRGTLIAAATIHAKREAKMITRQDKKHREDFFRSVLTGLSSSGDRGSIGPMDWLSAP